MLALLRNGVATCSPATKNTPYHTWNVVTTSKHALHQFVLLKMLLVHNTRVNLCLRHFMPPLKQLRDTQDALAIVNRLGRPHIFITVACTPKWKSLQENNELGQQVDGNPWLCDRVFEPKHKEAMGDLKSSKIFGIYNTS